MMSSFQTGRVSVWWDLDNCSLPPKVDSFHVAKDVSTMLLTACLTGPATIDAFGDTKRLKQKVLEGLSSTGINVHHIPSGNKDASDKAILVAMLFWALDNAPPASLVLISGDGDFANALHRLRLKGFNVLLVKPDQPVKSALLGAASSVWYWTSVVNGHPYIDGFSDSASGQRWVSVNDMKYEFPDDVWIEFCLFLQCETNRESIVKSYNRFEAARVLKFSGPARIQQLLMGQIILLLNQSIKKRNWLRTCGEGRSSVVVNLQAIMTFTQEQGAKPTDLVQNAQITSAAMTMKIAENLGRGLPSMRGELNDAILQQRLKSWLLQLPRSRKGYGLSFIQRGLMEDADIFLDLRQIEELINLFSDDFRFEKRKNGRLLFQKRQIPVPTAKQFIQDEPMDSVMCEQSIEELNLRVAEAATSESVEETFDSAICEPSKKGLNLRITEVATVESVGGELGSCKDGQTRNTTSPPKMNRISELLHGLPYYFVILATVFAGCRWLCREILKRF